MRRAINLLLILALTLTTLVARQSTVRADTVAPANAFFQHTWERTDLPVAQGLATHSWVWGPSAFSGPLGENYQEAPGGRRLTQYYDKSRMEINDPAGDTSKIWYVTNGLLAKELITGAVQLGDNTFDERGPADVNIAGDPNDPDGPTYASFATHLADAPPADGAPLDATLDRAGVVGCCAPSDVAASAGPLVTETGHRVASVFWDYLNTSGRIVENGRRTSGPLFANPFYATGYPIAEAYWARVRVAGIQQWVLTQPFERRVLTYTPANAPEWRVEMGNVGRHYYAWRYAATGATPANPPGWQLPAYPASPVPDGQQIEIPAADATYTLQLSADVDTGAVTAHEQIAIASFAGARPATLYLQIVPAVYGYFTLDSLTVDGVATAPQTLENGLILAIALPGGSGPLTLALDFRLAVGAAPNDFIGTVLDDGVLRLGYWFPIISDLHGYSETLDPSESQTAAFDVTLDVASDVVVAHTGDEVGRQTLDDGRLRYNLHAEHVRDFALALSHDFSVTTTTTASGVSVRLFGLPGNGGPGAADTILAAGVDALQQLEALVGPYPYATLDYVDVGPNMPGGLEFPNLIYINAAYDPLDRLIYHETAHQWVYGIIGNRTVLDGWIDEGGAEFFERGLPTGFTEVPSIPDGGYAYALDATYLEMPPDPNRNWYYSIYEQGARFYDDMLTQMGWDNFWAAWQASYARYAFTVVTPWQLLATFQEYSPTDLRPLFDAYFRYPWIWSLLSPGG